LDERAYARAVTAVLPSVLVAALLLTGGCALPPSSPVLSECPEIPRGDHIECVQATQNALFILEYDVDVDGIFGSRTEKAVRGFQGTRGLAVDGVAGRKTLTKLESSLPAGRVFAGSAGVFVCGDLFGTCTFYFNHRTTHKISDALKGPAGSLAAVCQGLKEFRARLACGLLGTLGVHAVRKTADAAAGNDACLAVDLGIAPALRSDRGQHCQR
jgi:hypothetical protein